MSFTFALEHEDGSPAEPPRLSTAVPNWSPGDTIQLAADRTFRVIATRDGLAADADPILVFEPVKLMPELKVLRPAWGGFTRPLTNNARTAPGGRRSAS